MVVDSDVWVPIPQIPLDVDIRQFLHVRVELPEGALYSFAGAPTPAVLWSFTVTPGDQLDYRPSDFLCVPARAAGGMTIPHSGLIFMRSCSGSAPARRAAP